MGIEIRKHPTGMYQIKTEGDRRLFLCNTAMEAAEAVKHYYNEEHDVKYCGLCKALADWNKIYGKRRQ